MSNFTFLEAEWPDLFEAAAKAEALACSDARGSCFYARRAFELAVNWLYTHDTALKLPCQDHLSALIHDPTFRQDTGPAVFAKTRVVKDLGNLAVHSHKPVRQVDALTAAKELFHYSNGYEYWLCDDAGYPPRPVQGFYKKAELELLIQRRDIRKRLADLPRTTPMRNSLSSASKSTTRIIAEVAYGQVPNSKESDREAMHRMR